MGALAGTRVKTSSCGMQNITHKHTHTHTHTQLYTQYRAYSAEVREGEYGALREGSNRACVLLWLLLPLCCVRRLEQVIKQSGQVARGEPLDAEHVVHIGPVSAEEPLGTYFVSYR